MSHLIALESVLIFNEIFDKLVDYSSAAIIYRHIRKLQGNQIFVCKTSSDLSNFSLLTY
jgi:hypothetical protein